MKVRKTQRLKKLIISWKIGDYFRQLSVVILGIVVTFMASDALTEYTQSREIRSTLQLVKNELEWNLEALKWISNRVELERRVSTYVLEYRSNLNRAEEDTLRKYQWILFQTRDFLYTKDAFDLLKTSSLFQKIKPRTVGLQVIKAYNALESSATTVKMYYQMKDSYLGGLMLDKRFDFYGTGVNIPIRDFWRPILEIREGWLLCNFSAHNFGPAPFAERTTTVEETIAMLMREYGLE